MSSAVLQQIDDYQKLSLAFQDVLGVIIAEEQRAMILAKLNRVMQAFELDSIVDLAEKMRRADVGRLNSDILAAITVGDSKWFHYPAISHLLHHYVLDNVADDARFWVAGCGDGSLAYSIAIDIAEYNRKNGQHKQISILATDVSSEGLEQAQQGCYQTAQMQGMYQDLLSMYLMKRDDLNEEFGDASGEVWEVKPKIRERVSFSHCDLLESCEKIGAVDVIIAPEILVYFSNGHRAGILDKFASQLSPAGILIVAEDQAVNSPGFERVVHPEGLFYRQKFSG